MLPIYLTELCHEPARRRTAATLVRRPPPSSPDEESLSQRRTRTVENLDRLADGFAAVVEGQGVGLTRAANAAAAAARIAHLAAGTPVAVTRSAVLGELHGALAQRGVRVVRTYGPGKVPFDAQRKWLWQLPRRIPAASWTTRAVTDAGRDARDVVGLFGVNAASAATGHIYLLQHSSNVGDLLRAARLIIFVVAIDKITADDAAARQQVEASGRHGADRVLLDLARTTPLGDVLGQFAAAAGPAAVELILLDNGRRKLHGTRYQPLLTCIGCGACASRCPTYPEFRGALGWNPKDYLWSHLRGENPTLQLCTSCGNCEVDCPVDIPLPTLIAARRSEDLVERGRGLADWRRRLHGEVEMIGKLFSATAPLSRWVSRLPGTGAVMETVFGLTAKRRLPPFRRVTLERWHRRRAPAAGRGRRPAVVYYFGCFANYNHPEVGQATVRVLEALGYDVILPRWRCCGIPLYAKGEIAAARRLVDVNLRVLAAYVGAGHEIVTSCPSCQLALVRDYPRLFPSAQAETVAQHTHFLSRFLLQDAPLAGRLAAQHGRAAYHVPCHLRALGLESDSLALLARVPELQLTDVDRGCCGLSGTFGLERTHHAQSMQIGEGLFAAVKSGGFDLVITDCGACQLQIEHGTAHPVTHPAQVLLRALQVAQKSGAGQDEVGAASSPLKTVRDAAPAPLLGTP